VDPELIVRDFNKGAERLLGLEGDALRGIHLSQALVAPSDAPGIAYAISAIEDVFRQTETPPLPETFRIATASGEKIVSIRSTHLTEMGIFTKDESPAKICAVVVQIIDLTEQKRREEVIEQEIDRLKVILQRVIPGPIVNQLAEGTESVSFAVQSASIGCIRVSFDKREATADDPFGGVHKLFNLFDEWMAPFSQLTMVSVLANEYIFAGGVFTATNKPEKHAEEATRFGLKILGHGEDIKASVGSDVSILIGINTGGPLVAGVMNARSPLFQLLGTPVYLARCLAETGVSGQIHVTRSVYELVYSHNFRVTERGDTKVKGGQSVHSYLITP
jgi:hypothetical protein